MARSEAGGARRTFGLPFTALAVLIIAIGPRGNAQQTQGFAIERFYPSAPGAGWFVMNDLNMSGGLGGTIALITSYGRNSLEITGTNGANFPLVANEAYLHTGLAVTYDRYRVYLNLPLPLAVNGENGTLGQVALTAPAFTIGNNPDTLSDPTMGFDVRILGKPGGSLRLGASAELIFPSGNRADYATDATFRGIFRALVAGDSGHLTYAGQLGFHARPLTDLTTPDGPDGNEFLFGGSVGRKFSVGQGWTALVGPEIYGETAVHSFFSLHQTGAEALMTARFETGGDSRRLRIRMGIGHSLVQHFGASEWRILFGIELLGQSSKRISQGSGE